MIDKKKSKKKEKVTSLPKKNTQAKAENKPKILVKEDVYPASEIADILNISTFDFYIIKKNAGIDEGSFLTISEFQKMYDKIIKGR